MVEFICYKDADYCDDCEHKQCDTAHRCPLGGDLANDCADCSCNTDYQYDPKTGECIRREKRKKELKEVNRNG